MSVACPMRPAFRFSFVAISLLALTATSFAEDTNCVISDRQKGDKVELIARLKNLSDVTIDVSLKLVNMRCNKKIPFRTVIKSEGSHVLFELSPIHPNREWKYHYEFAWKSGHNLVGKPKAFFYRLPYLRFKSRVTQGPYGTFSHGTGSQDEEAIDFLMPVGTKLCAARAGRVIGLRSDATLGGVNKKFKKDFNYVLIRHDDGTFAEYAHLKHDGVFVKIGQEVKEGDAIGLSGNTGFTSSPHLHFSVFYTVSGSKRITIPVTFKSAYGNHFKPVQGGIY